ncbi:hypothetical protein [Sphingobacterium sp. LRF_L2]|uniref:hypothetical protein n=1 Tax=Sphingobacterium sp. LRF_L2 TaxID=3369421 RepID=UPI003F623454
MNPFLIFSSVFLLVLTSCGSYRYPESSGVRNIAPKELNNYYADTSKSFVYRAKIEAFGCDVNGSLLIKTVQPDVHRVALVSDFGQTLLDVTLFPYTYTKHYAMDDLDRSVVVKEIVDIFRVLTERRFSSEALIFMDKQRFPVYLAKDSYYTFENRQMLNISRVKGKKEHFLVSFRNIQGLSVEEVSIEHRRFPITMHLVLDKKQSTL